MQGARKRQPAMLPGCKADPDCGVLTRHPNQIIMHVFTYGGVPERSKGSDCKSDGSAFEGSNPSPSTKVVREECGCSSMVEPQPSKLMAWVRFPSPAPFVAFKAHIAQSVEHFLGKEEVTGSSPVMGSTFL